MNKRKQKKWEQNPLHQDSSLNLHKTHTTVEEKKEDLPPQAPPPSPEKNSYSYTKHGDYFNLGCAGFFAFFLIVPAISVGISGNTAFMGSFILFMLGMIPVKFMIQEIYQKKTTLTKTEVQYYQSAAFRKTISWTEPIDQYNYVSEKTTDDASEAILWHSSDDSKNVILYSTYYKHNESVFENIEEIQRFLNHTNYGKHQKHIQVKRSESFVDRSFFEVYNQSKKESRGWKNLLLPDKHLKILKDEDRIFSAAVNKGKVVFMTGLICLALSFLILPVAFEIHGLGAWVFIFHFTGVLLFNLGTTEQIIQLETRSLKIGTRWFKRKVIVKDQIPFADIRAIDVSSIKNEENYFLKIITDTSVFEFGKGIKKEELDWLSEILVDRIIIINGIFNASIQTHRY